MKEDCVVVVAFGFGVNMGRWSLDEKYDVFLNFRGDDTRRGFTSHLYNALNQRCINTYIDYKIARGEDVWPELVKAIKQSRVSIVVFSKDYASSTWCLKELVEILECRKEGQVVIPVFYDVDPSDIRGLSGSYGKAFAKHDRDQGQGDTDRQSYKQILLRWKDALKEAANISGWDCSHRDESLVIQNVVNDVMQKLYLRYPVELKGLFKNKKPYKQVKLLLKTTRVIGIWGMGGSGKSTIAKFLFAKLFPNYDNVCFMANSKEFSLAKLFFALFKEEVSTSNVVVSEFDMRKLQVRQECTANPGKRSRLKDNEAGEVIKKNTGTDAIHGITLDLSQMEDLALCADTLSKMKNLKILKLYNSLGKSSSNTYLNLPATLKPFSDQLRYIEWIGYPFEYIPSPFCTKFLVEIHMPQSKVKQLWQGIQELHNLEVIDLSECKQFEKLPNLSNAKKLKWVNLSGCGSLLHLHPSVLSSKTLVTLILDRCTKLKKVRGKKHLKHLQKISVNGCLNLEEFAVSSDLIENLDLSHTRIQTLDPSIQNMHNLKWLNLEGLRLKILIKEISCLTSLKELKISNSSLKIDKQRLHVLFKGLKSLEILYLQNCSNLFELPNNIDVLSQLKELRLDGSNVKNLPESIKNLQDLEILSLENCKGLECLPELPFGIKYLGVINCTSLELVSNLKSLATRMLGMTKRVTFKNSFKMDTHSLKHIMKGLYLTMMNAAIENVSVRTLGTINGYNYNSVELCLPGGKVPSIPWKINHRTTNLSITVKLPKPYKLLGFIYSVVLSPITGMKKHDCRITCKCYLPNEDMKEAWLDSDIGGLKSDHVYVWYDPLHCDNILKYNAPKVRFEFCVANNKGEVDSSICIKECGIRLIRVSNMFSILSELQLDSKNKKDLETREVVETGKRIIITSTKRSDEEENNDKRNQIGDQQRELSEYNSFDNIAGMQLITLHLFIIITILNNYS
ncbi:hypothetical protein VNO78_15776 [Psophocarpus tetragonolobus]|uniref:TIR domain-containing protein n=1 Tax=Psophocarpus tetragonolobus TaxID=3891 RepID=A0AAN9SJE8_PSOTE